MLSRERLEELAKQEPCTGECEDCERILMARELEALKESLKVAVELTEMDDEFNRVGTDSWVWLQLARTMINPPARTDKGEA